MYYFNHFDHSNTIINSKYLETVNVLCFPGGSVGEELPAIQETWVRSWVGKMLWRREWQPNPAFLPGDFHGQRSLAGYSPWDHKESDMTKQLTLSCSIYVMVLMYMTLIKARKF